MNNIKKSFKYIGKEFKNFKINEKCLLNAKFKIRKQYQNNIARFIDFDKIKYKKIYKLLYKCSNDAWKKNLNRKKGQHFQW